MSDTNTRGGRPNPASDPAPPASHGPAGAAGEPPLRAEGVGKSYRLRDRRVDVLHSADLTADRGRITALMGRSGSGKSTLLHILGLLTPPDSGRVLIDGTDTAQAGDEALAELRRRHIGFVFQAYNLLPQHSALRNVQLPARGPWRATAGRGRELLERVGLADRAGHRPSELSGGEQQRVALARALVNEPTVILADEPTGNLDEANEELMLRLFRELADEGKAVVIVTHNRSVSAIADEVLTMAGGRITARGEDGE